MLDFFYKISDFSLFSIYFNKIAFILFMLLKSVVIKKDNLTTVNESCTLEEALSILEDSGYR